MTVGAVEINGSDDADRELATVPDLFIVPGKDLSDNATVIAREPGRFGSLVQFPVRLAAGSTVEPRFGALPFDSATAYRVVKRSLDILIALVALILLIPLFIVVGTAIRLTTPGPVLFRHRRVGQDGRDFACLKFRTMVADADRRLKDDARLHAELKLNWKLKRDPRVTPVGRVLRRSSLDELPQLLNVLRGEMSLVGPRPVPRLEYEMNYSDHGVRIFSVKPGITGLWQVSGRSELSYGDRVRLDLEYVGRCSLWFDIQVLLKTIPAVITRRGAV